MRENRQPQQQNIFIVLSGSKATYDKIAEEEIMREDKIMKIAGRILACMKKEFDEDEEDE